MRWLELSNVAALYQCRVESFVERLFPPIQYSMVGYLFGMTIESFGIVLER